MNTCLKLVLPALILAGAGRVMAQADTTISLPRAFQLIQAQDYKEAQRVLEVLVQRPNPNGRMWTLLGLARFRNGDLKGALQANQSATAFEPSRPTALYNTGLVYAAMQQPDTAFWYLFEAKKTNRIDMTQIGSDPDAEPLRKDPRYQALFPSAEEYAHPFVESARILQDWHGEAAGDQFGWIARNAGDLDHDGINDVTTSSPTSTIGGANAGRVFAYSTKNGRLLWARDGEPGAQLGIGIEAAGDVNHDGTPDVIAGAPGAGKAFVYSGKDGATLLTLAAENPSDGFGRHVSDLGDVNRDGYADVLVGAPNSGANGANAGRAYLFSGKDGSVLLRLTGEAAGDNFGSTVAGAIQGRTTWILVGAGAAGPSHTGRTYVYEGLKDTPAFIIESDSTGAAQGAMFISVVGDVDHDGTADIYSSDWPNSARGRSTGRIYVYSGKTGRPLLTLTGENAGDGFGIGVADMGDINRDGNDDLVIGAWQFAGAAPSGGKIYVYSGKDGSLIRTLTGQVPGETLGFDATGLGDVNGDSVPDMLVTSAWSAINGTRSGRVLVVSGK
jgi:hypothetical protein